MLEIELGESVALFLSALFMSFAPQALDLGMDALEDVGKLVCKFGSEKLKGVLLKVLTFVAGQSPEALGNLPALINTLANQPAELMEVIGCELRFLLQL